MPNVVCLEQLGELDDNRIGTKRGSALAHSVQNNQITLAMRYRQRETIGAAARRIDEGAVFNVAKRLAFNYASVDKGGDKIN